METGTIVMAVITFASVVVALYSVWDTKRRYIDSIQPIISFKLSCKESSLNLEIINTGKSPAHSLTVEVVDIMETAILNNKKHDLLSGTTFDLYPDEVVCNQIALILGGTCRAIVMLDVSYVDDWGKFISIRRTVSLFNEDGR